MAKKKRNAKKKTSDARSESQRAEAITVFWMMSLLATVISEAGALLAKSFCVFVEPYPALVLLSGLLLLIACVTGALCLGLIPLVLRWRRVAPPTVITQFAVIAGVLPIVTLVAVLLTGG